ncbi:hypothetical protein KCG44_05105 [Pacificimonas sp. WHA3]|uniref:Uncharacterized protein n=1 Tax=Pacificimonas pallii TaxID=2827236 RepID=A0ABS6SCQ0_9SPHN|nr:hypothetical protein [Pacificimonas pallii]MBV7256159.1 hypothetical protein [Pacificimonas pallii]
MSMIRIAGMVLVVLGMQIWTKGAFGFQDEWIGKSLSVVGVACMLLVPSLLRKRWRETDERAPDSR